MNDTHTEDVEGLLARFRRLAGATRIEAGGSTSSGTVLAWIGRGSACRTPTARAPSSG